MKSSAQKKNQFDTTFNPLDGFERVLIERKTLFTRPIPEALSLSLEGNNIDFFWNDDDEALHCSCAIDVMFEENNRDLAAPVIMHINRRQWLGHFEIHEDGAPVFRYTLLFHGSSGMSDTDKIQELAEIALRSCEQYKAAFQLMAQAKGEEDFPRLFDSLGGMEPLALALIDVSGQS